MEIYEVFKNMSSLVRQDEKLYDTDFYLWTVEQVKALQNHRAEDLDWENLRDEIEDLGREQIRSIESYIQQIIIHRLKLQYVDDVYSTKHWLKEINTFTDNLEDRLTTSLRNKVDLPKLYTRARRYVIADYPRLKKVISDECSFELDELISNRELFSCGSNE